MNYILLDIDGVLLKLSPWKSLIPLEDNFYAFESIPVQNLNKILNLNCQIILISSHRKRFSNIEWKSIFEKRGIISEIQILETNETLKFNQILDWVGSNSDKNYVIIDDDKRLSDLPKEIKERFVLVDSYLGLTSDNVEKAINILNIKIQTDLF